MRDRRYQTNAQRQPLLIQAPALFLGLVAAGVAGIYSIM